MRYSSKTFNKHLAGILDNLGFKPSRCEASIWFRENGDIYKYIATHVDDLSIVMNDPLYLIEQLKRNPKLKGAKELSF